MDLSELAQNLKYIRNGIEILGTAIGTNEFVENFMGKKIQEYSTFPLYSTFHQDILTVTARETDIDKSTTLQNETQLHTQTGDEGHPAAHSIPLNINRITEVNFRPAPPTRPRFDTTDQDVSVLFVGDRTLHNVNLAYGEKKKFHYKVAKPGATVANTYHTLD